MDGTLKVVAVVSIFGYEIYRAWRSRQTTEKARAAYRASLEQLAKDPANATLRTSTLRLGFAYSDLTREPGGDPSFDIKTLSNEVNAACASASTIVPSAASSPMSTAAPTLKERLVRLDELKEQGLVGIEEYDLKRKQLLDEV